MTGIELEITNVEIEIRKQENDEINFQIVTVPSIIEF